MEGKTERRGERERKERRETEKTRALFREEIKKALLY